MACFGVFFFTSTNLLARIGSVIVVLSAAVLVAYPAWRKRAARPAPPDASPRQKLEAEWRRVEVEVALLRSMHWWFILPGTVGVLIFLAGIHFSRTWTILFAWFIVSINLFTYWTNQVACRKNLLPIKRELASELDIDEPNPAPESRRNNLVPYAAIVAAGALATWIFWFVLAVEEPRVPGFDDVSAFTSTDHERIDAWLEEQVVLAKLPSLSVAVVRDGQIVYQRAFGFADLETSARATPETSYHVASVTKVFTTTLAAILHERGVIDLDTPVISYLPKGVSISKQPELGATMTLRQLASHTSGLPRGVPGRVQSVDGRYELDPQRLYNHLAEVNLAYDPGTDELYSNLGMGLLGHALACAAGNPFDRLLRELVCEPLRLQRTSIESNDILRVATGYSSTVPRFAEAHSYGRRLAPSGGLIASAPDLAWFLAAQMKPGVFSSNMLAQLHTPTRLANGSTARRGLGWRIRSNEFLGTVLSKNGGRNNCSAWIGFAPSHRTGVAVATNCGEPDVDPIGLWLLERSVPGGRKPATPYGYAKVAPYTGVRWKDDRPIVRVHDRWRALVSIDGIPIERILEFAEREFGALARKRFVEDLVELLSKMGHAPDWDVTLGLQNADGHVEEVRVRMTERNRNLARE